MFGRSFLKRANRISMLITVIVVTCVLLWDEGGESFSKPMNSAAGAAQIMALDHPLVRIESTDEVCGVLLQAVIVRRLTVQSFKGKVVRQFFYAILNLLLAVASFMLLQRLLHAGLHQSQRIIVSYIHDQDGQK